MKQQGHQPSHPLVHTPCWGTVKKIPILKPVLFPLWRHNKMMSIFKTLFRDSFQSHGTSVHPGEKQLFVSEFILELLLQPNQNLLPIPVQKAAPCSTPVPSFLCQEHHPVASSAMALPLRHPNSTKIFEGEGKNQKPGIAQRAVWISWAKPLDETRPVNKQ